MLKGTVCRMDGWRGYVVVLSATTYNESPIAWGVLVAPITRHPAVAYGVALIDDDPVAGHVRLTDIHSAERSDLSDPLGTLSPATQRRLDMELQLLLDL